MILCQHKASASVLKCEATSLGDSFWRINVKQRACDIKDPYRQFQNLEGRRFINE
jgi:hypothetical protein